MVQDSTLGQKVAYNPHYDADILFPIPRLGKRLEIGIEGALPFQGVDVWNHYEVSWLNPKGKPMVALVELTYPCTSDAIIESKSMKLYFNSFNNTTCQDANAVKTTIERDISCRIGAPVIVHVTELCHAQASLLNAEMKGQCLDELDIDCSIYTVHPHYLLTTTQKVEETLYSNLLKSNCLVTHQPDWGSVQIDYQGHQIDHEGLLKYLVSFRNHNEFHEQCIERIFMDIMRQCAPEKLAVCGRYTRRGGLDINVYRSTLNMTCDVDNQRLIRQ